MRFGDSDPKAAHLQIFGVIRGRDSDGFSLYLMKYPDSTCIMNSNFTVREALVSSLACLC